jgi:ketosteroid isomerase-like protein
MPTPDSAVFADDWVRAWNEHDVEAVLAHFHDDVVFSSPVAARMFPETGGVVRGKDALREYWVTALRVLRGESVLVLDYRNERGGLVNEVLTFDGDLVREGHGTYLT